MVDLKTTPAGPFASTMDKVRLAYPFETSFDVYAGFARQALDVVAEGLQAQANYVRSLAACKNPADLLTCNNAYACHILESCLQAGRNATTSFQASPQA